MREESESHTMNLEDETVLEVVINQIEFVKKISAARNVDDFHKRILAVLTPLGFTDFTVAVKLKSGLISFLLSTFPDGLTASYSKARYQRYDMLFDYIAAGNIEPVCMSMMEKIINSAAIQTFSFQKNREIFELYKQFGYEDLYLVPRKSTREGEAAEVVVFAAASESAEDFQTRVDNCRPVLNLLAEAIGFIGRNKGYVRTPKPPLRPRQLELLTLLAKNNLTIREAADKLFISIDTANKHMATAKRAMGTKHQANAIYLAIKQGLINLD